jgi:lysophospholipase L1-like esterase
MSITMVVALGATLAAAQQVPPLRFARWESEVRAIEKRLDTNQPKKGGWIFAGSSSIRLWDVAKSFPDWPISNVGFGGSEIQDCTYFAHRLITRLEPSKIVFYAGDNDIASGRTAIQVAEEFHVFSKTIHDRLPECQILFIAIKPSLKRWALFDIQTDANERIRKYCTNDVRLQFVDVVKPMLAGGGKPPADLFLSDELHLSAKGYTIWTGQIRELTEKMK